MKKHLATFLTLCGFLAMTAAAYFSHKSRSFYGDTNQPYDKLWKKVDSCRQKGLSESALKVIEVIYQKAKSEKNTPQLVKALLNRTKFENYKEENSLQKMIERFEKEAAENHFPATPILRSIIAEAYWNYYQNNRWYIQQRSKLEVKGNDLATWDLSAISTACVKNYLASLQPADSLKSLRLEVYEPILTDGNLDSRKLRPTLYDFLLHRTTDFFKNSEADVNRPAETFSMNNAAYLLWYKDFLGVSLPVNADTFNLNYYALKLLQEAERFHAKDENPEALINVELERLNWVWKNNTVFNKDSLYLSALDKLQEKFASYSASAEIAYHKANWYQLKGNEYRPLNSDSLKWHKKTAHQLASEAVKKFPTSYGADLCKQMLAILDQKTIICQTEQVNEPKTASRALIRYKNVSEIYFKVFKTTLRHNEELTREYYNEKLIAKYLSLPLAQSFSYKVPEDGDFNEHSVEIKIPELDLGYYIVLASTSPEFKTAQSVISYFNFQASNINWQNQRLPNGDFEFFLMHRMTGKPLAKAKAIMWFDKYDYITRNYRKEKGPEYTTDDNGMFTIQASHFENYKYFTLEFNNGEDHLQSIQSFYVYKYNEGEQSTFRTFFFTDRSIYRPGQTIQFKLLHVAVNGKDCKIQPKKTLTLSFRDVNYQEISTLTVTTNDYGTASGSFTAPQGVLNGQMSIYETYGSASVRVEEYKRPTFEVTSNPVEGTYRPNDEISFSGKAMAYSGQAADGATVKYRVARNTQLPYWYWWYRPWHNAGGAAEIISGTTITNDTGAFFVKFKAIPDEQFTAKDNVIFNYTIYADITDINGETHSIQQTVNVGYQALYLDLSVDDKINKTETNKIHINARNANYTPEKAQGTLRVYSLKKPERIFRARLWQEPDKHLYSREEYYKMFPNDLYDDELNQYKWQRGEKVFETTFNANDTAGISLTALSKLTNGIFLIEAVTKDKAGIEVKDIKYTTTYALGENEVTPINEPDWFEPVKVTAEPGEKTSFIMSSAHKDASYLLQVERDKKIISRHFMPASMKAFEIPVTEDMRGNFVCHISLVKNNRYYYHQQLISIPFSNKDLEISTETFRNKLLPGQNEEWKIVIKNKKGEKETAELLASMYDASLDAFVPHYWSTYFFPYYYSQIYLQSNTDNVSNSYSYLYDVNESYNPEIRIYDDLNDFDALQGYRSRYYYSKRAFGAQSQMDYAADEISEKKVAKEEQSGDANIATTTATGGFVAMNGKAASGETLKNADKAGGKDLENDQTRLETSKQKEAAGNEAPVQMRTNFSETAFFYPQMQSNDQGEVIIKFTMPDAVTRWKFMAFAHTKNLKSGQIEKEVITQKKIMVQVNAPRFFREGDKIFLPAKISNTSQENYEGKIELTLLDAVTNENITAKILNATTTAQNFKVDKSKSTSVNWELTIPQGIGAITYKVVAKTNNVSDGEENTAPVLTNRMLVTESMPLPVRGNHVKNFSFEKLLNQNNSSYFAKS